MKTKIRPQLNLDQRIFYVAAWTGWNCLNFLQVFVGYQANFPGFYSQRNVHSSKFYSFNLILSNCLYDAS